MDYPAGHLQNYQGYVVVINAAARTKTSTASYGGIMKEALREMRELTVFWIINRHRDSIELLYSFQESAYRRTYPRLSKSVLR